MLRSLESHDCGCCVACVCGRRAPEPKEMQEPSNSRHPYHSPGNSYLLFPVTVFYFILFNHSF